MASGENSIDMHQLDSAPLTWIRVRGAAGSLIEPSSYDYSDGTAVKAYLTSSAGSVNWASLDMRNDNYRTLQEPWSGSYMNLGVNAKDPDELYLIGDGGVWQSGDAGVHWNEKDGTGLNLPSNQLSPVNCEDSMVATIADNFSTARSLNAGDEFEESASGISEQAILFYGDLGVPVDTTYKFFAYERPSDIVWESEYGYLPSSTLDRYETHYVLPYPISPTSANDSVVEIELDSVYGRNVLANEFTDDWLYLYLKETGELVDKKRISRNTAGSAGSTFIVYVKALNTAPTSSHVVQIIKDRAEVENYYTLLTRNSALKYNIYHELDGSSFLLDQERESDYYADMKSIGGLPSHIQTEANEERINNLHVELNRQRVSSGLNFNDSNTVPEEALAALGYQLGVDLDESLDLRTQRRVASLWFPLVDAYGACLDGVTNLINLILGDDSGVSATITDPDGDTLSGTVLNINLSGYADYSWDYVAADNTIEYDTVEEKWAMSVDLAYIPAELKTLVHRHLIHFRGLVTDGPLLITQHEFKSVSNYISVFFDKPDIAELGLLEGESVLCIYSEPKQRRVFKFISLLKQLIPNWVQVKIS